MNRSPTQPFTNVTRAKSPQHQQDNSPSLGSSGTAGSTTMKIQHSVTQNRAEDTGQVSSRQQSPVCAVIVLLSGYAQLASQWGPSVSQDRTPERTTCSIPWAMRTPNHSALDTIQTTPGDGNGKIPIPQEHPPKCPSTPRPCPDTNEQRKEKDSWVEGSHRELAWSKHHPWDYTIQILNLMTHPYHHSLSESLLFSPLSPLTL